jgi:hypothetical protein
MRRATPARLPLLDFSEFDGVLGKELVVDLLEGHVDGGTAPLQVEGRVQMRCHQDAHVVLEKGVVAGLLRRAQFLGGAPAQKQQHEDQPIGHSVD